MSKETEQKKKTRMIFKFNYQTLKLSSNYKRRTGAKLNSKCSRKFFFSFLVYNIRNSVRYFILIYEFFFQLLLPLQCIKYILYIPYSHIYNNFIAK